MNRIGVFTGKIYPEETKIEDISECAILDSSSKSLEFYKELKKRCKHCRICPEAKKFRENSNPHNED